MERMGSMDAWGGWKWDVASDSATKAARGGSLASPKRPRWLKKIVMSESALPPHRKVRVDLGPRAYDVVIGRGIISSSDVLMRERSLLGVPLVIADTTVQSSHYVHLNSAILRAFS